MSITCFICHEAGPFQRTLSLYRALDKEGETVDFLLTAKGTKR